MSDPQHKMAMDAIGFAAQMLALHTDQYVALTRAVRDMDSYLHITDPTLYLKASRSDNLRWQVELSEAALAFIRAVQTVKEEIAEAAP